MALTGHDDPSSVATHVHSCLDGFQNACNSMSKAELHVKRKLPPGSINDELGRFSIWSGNVGAHRRGKGSLDYKLREASHIRDRVIELLQNLRSVLQEAIEIITGERVAWEDLSDSESDTSDDGIQQTEEQPTTELAQLTSNMAEINTCLMRLSMAIRNPAPHDQFKESTHIDVAHFETFDIDHVRGKFPMAKEYLVVRLGKAISRRRQYLRYREEHRKKLEQGLKQPPKQGEVVVPQSTPRTVTAPSEKIESTVASSIPTVAKESASAAALDENDYYEDALSQTSYASSTDGAARMRPPPLPEAGLDGDPFECPLCFRFTSVRQTAAWHKHVFRDLQPYVCTSEECEIPDRTYESRHEWFHHESQVHRNYWECVEGCNQCFQSPETLRTHLWHDHPNLATEDRIEDLIRSCERHDGLATSAECPLCQLQLPSLPLLRRHLGKHHEELSLFALPSHMKENHEGSGDEGNDDGSRSLPSVAADGRSLSPFLDADEELDDPNDDNENELETISQPSTSGSSLSSLSSRPAILYCDSGDCEAKFDGKHRRIDLARHLRFTHGRLSLYHCEDPDCDRRFYEEDTRLKHYRKHHPYLAYNRSTSNSTLTLDEYLDGLVTYYRERGIELDVDRRDWGVDDRTVSIRDVRKAMEGQGGYHRFTANYAWAELGREFGQSTRLTASGVDQVKKIYSQYFQPFDEYLERNGGKLANMPTDNSMPSVKASEEKDQSNMPKLTLHVRVFSSSSDFPTLGTIEPAEEVIWYFPDGSNRRFAIPLANVRSLVRSSPNEMQFEGPLYENLNGSMKLVEAVAPIRIEFLNAKDNDVAYYRVRTHLDLVYTTLQNTVGLGEQFKSLDDPTGRSIRDIEVRGLTAGPILVSVTFKEESIQFWDLRSGNIWDVDKNDIEAVVDCVDSFTLSVRSVFWPGEQMLGSMNLHLTTDNLVNLGQLRRFLDSYTPRVHVLPQSKEKEEEDVPGETSVVSQISDTNEPVTTIDQGLSSHEQNEKPPKPSPPLLRMDKIQVFQVKGEDFGSPSPDTSHFPSRGTLWVHASVLNINLQSQSIDRSWSSSDSIIPSIRFDLDNNIEISGIIRIDTDLPEYVRIWLEYPDEVETIRLVLDNFLRLASDGRQSLLVQQGEMDDVKAQNQTQSPSVTTVGAIKPPLPSAESVGEKFSFPANDQVVICGACFALIDGSVQLTDAWVTIAMDRQELTIWDASYQGKQWRFWIDEISDVIRTSPTRVQYVAKSIIGYENIRPRVLLDFNSESEAKLLFSHIGKHANNSAAGNDDVSMDREPNDGHEAKFDLRSKVLDTSHMVTPAEQALPKDSIESREQTAKQSGRSNISSQGAGEAPSWPAQHLKDRYPPDPEADELGVMVQIVYNDGFVSQDNKLELRLTYLRIVRPKLRQIWSIYYRNVTIVFESGDVIHLRGTAFCGPMETTTDGDILEVNFSIKPATSSQKTEILHRLQEKGVVFQPRPDKFEGSPSAPLPPEDNDKQGGSASTTSFFNRAIVKMRGYPDMEGTLYFEHDRLVAEDPSTSQKWIYKYESLSRILDSGTQLSFRDNLHDNWPGIQATDVTVVPSLPENVAKIVSLLKEHISDLARPIVPDSGGEPQDAEIPMQVVDDSSQREERIPIREADIIRRCQLVDPPIPPQTLRQMSTFKAAVQVQDPMTDTVFELLLPRLRAELEGNHRLLHPRTSKDEEDFNEEHLPPQEGPKGSQHTYLVAASIFRSLKHLSERQAEHLRKVYLEFLPDFVQLRNKKACWRMQYHDIRRLEEQKTKIRIEGVGRDFNGMDSPTHLTEDNDSIVIIISVNEQDAKAILTHLKDFRAAATQGKIEELHFRVEDKTSSESELELESEAPIKPKPSTRKAPTDDPGTSTSTLQPPSYDLVTSIDYGTAYTGIVWPISRVDKPEIDTVPDWPTPSFLRPQQTAEQGHSRQILDVDSEPREEFNDSADDERDNDVDEESVNYASNENEHEQNLSDDEIPLLTAQETVYDQQAQSMKPGMTGAVIKTEFETLNSDPEDKKTSSELALQRARQSGVKPSEWVKRPKAAVKDEEVRDSPENGSEAPHKYQCVFWFFYCDYVSSDEEEWKDHCLFHFGREEPPPLMRCPICLDWSAQVAMLMREGWSYLDHLYGSHGSSLERLFESSQPDDLLLGHLKTVGIISEKERERIANGERVVPKSEEFLFGRRWDFDNWNDSGVEKVDKSSEEEEEEESDE